MRPAIYAISAMILSSCSPYDPSPGYSEVLDAIPGNITYDYDAKSGRSITGHWNMVRANYFSRGAGGACLLVHVEKTWPALSVSDQTDCENVVNFLFGSQGHSYYDEIHSCWIKESDENCIDSLIAMKANIPTRWEVGPHLANTKPISLAKYPDESYWAVYSCIMAIEGPGAPVRHCHLGTEQKIIRSLVIRRPPTETPVGGGG